jgi:hypothetical protein
VRGEGTNGKTEALDRRLVAAPVDRGDLGERLPRRAGGEQRLIQQRRHLDRVRAGRGADARHEAGWMKGARPHRAGEKRIGDDDANAVTTLSCGCHGQAGLGTEGSQRLREGPRHLALEHRSPAIEHRRGHARDVPCCPQAGQRVEGEAAGHVGGGGHHRLGSDRRRDRARELVGATGMTAHERDGVCAGIVDTDDRGVDCL